MCATLQDAVGEDDSRRIYGCDESLDILMCDPDNGGFIVLTRYKRRGTVSSAVWVGDFWPTRTVTLELIERAIAYRERTE